MGVSPEMVARGQFEASPLYDMLRTAERFGQDPIAFAKTWRDLSRAEINTLLWYGAFRTMQEAGR